jgi:hypothetical protein
MRSGTTGTLPDGDPRGGGVQDDDAGLPGRWVSYADVRVAAQVDTVNVAGRVVPVPRHGRLAVV